jgi:hypothetical protein
VTADRRALFSPASSGWRSRLPPPRRCNTGPKPDVHGRTTSSTGQRHGAIGSPRSGSTRPRRTGASRWC